FSRELSFSSPRCNSLPYISKEFVKGYQLPAIIKFWISRLFKHKFQLYIP
ncbi:hypothetical protein TorRG33x02_171320, partial [Trema orientale]